MIVSCSTVQDEKELLEWKRFNISDYIIQCVSVLV